MIRIRKTLRLSIAIILALTTTALFGCDAKQPASAKSESSHSQENSMSQQPVTAMELAYEAVVADPGYASQEGISVAYDSDRLELELRVSAGFTEADAAWVMGIVAPILRGQDVRLKMSTADSTVILPLEQFTPYFDFTSLELSFDSGNTLRQATGMETLAYIDCLKTLDIGNNEPGILPILPQLETLILAPWHKGTGITSTFSFAGLVNLPALQTLVVEESNNKDILFVDLDAVSSCANLRELKILENNELASLEYYKPSSARGYFLCEAALACPTLTTIQNQLPGSFDLQALSNKQGREDYLGRVDAFWNRVTQDLRLSVFDRYGKGQIAVMGSVPVLDAPFILHGASNDGSIPDAYLRQNLAGGDVRYLVVVDSRSGNVVKYNNNGVKGYETINYFYIYDIVSDMVSPETIVARTVPPDFFQDSASRGEKLPEAALPYIAALLC